MQTFSAKCRSIDILSTDLDSSTEGSVGETQARGIVVMVMISLGMKVMTTPHSLVAPFLNTTGNELLMVMTLCKQLAQSQQIQAQRAMMKDLLHGTS